VRLRGAIAAVLLAAAASILALAFAEAFLRIRAPYLAGSHQHPSNVPRDELEDKPQSIDYDPYLGWKLRPNQHVVHQGWEFRAVIETNALGFRDGETTYARSDARWRILLLGDSFGFGYGVERRFGFADRLEDKLPGIEVVNLSVTAYGTDQELLLYDAEGSKFDVDVVMLALTVSNDFADIVKDRSFVLYKPYFEARDGRLELRGTPPPEPIRSGSSPDAPAYDSPVPVHDFLDRKSALYGFVFERLSTVDALRARFETMRLLVPQIDVYTSDQVGILCKVPNEKQEQAWQLMLALLDAWQEGVRQHGAQPLLLLIPSQLQVSESAWARVAAQRDLSADRFDPAYPHEHLKAYCAERDLAVIDLLPPFREESARGRRLYFRRDPHWNRYGHEFAAECIARELRRLGIAGQGSR
jgi:hypothetical protein